MMAEKAEDVYKRQEVYREFIYNDTPYVSACHLEGIEENVVLTVSYTHLGDHHRFGRSQRVPHQPLHLDTGLQGSAVWEPYQGGGDGAVGPAPVHAQSTGAKGGGTD